MPEVIGTLTTRNDAGFEEARAGRVFNALRPDRRPAAVLEAACDADVIAGVRLAKERGWQVSVRSGGHSWPAWSVRDDALLIDLGKMRDIDVDVEAGIARVRPAVTGAELLPQLARHGLMFQTGHAPDVGLGGYLLQGGAGWNTRGWGWACEHILAIDVVTADGEHVRASEDENADLLWAARGAGPGFFGVVTTFELRLRSLPAAITQSLYVCRPQHFDDVLAWAIGSQASISPLVEYGVASAAAPGGGERAVVLNALAFADTHDEAVEVLRPFEQSPVAQSAVQTFTALPTTLRDQFDLIARSNPSTLRYACDSAWIDVGPAEAVAALRDGFLNQPTPFCEALWMSMGPRRELPDMAFTLPTESYVAIYAKWEDAADDDANHDWIGSLMTRLRPLSKGVFLGDCDLARREAPFMADANRRRLEEIRSRRDPDGLFCSYLTAT